MAYMVQDVTMFIFASNSDKAICVKVEIAKKKKTPALLYDINMYAIRFKSKDNSE